MKVLTLKFSDTGETQEVHMLNPGESFPHFGGSRHACIAHKTASLILHRVSPMSTHDSELDIFDKNFWAWMARLINEGQPPGVVAEHDAN